MKLHYVPVFGSAFMTLGLAISYTISVSLGHVYFWFPFISDTGAEPPESAVFGFTLNITAVLLVVAMYLRYCQVNCIKDVISLGISNCWNRTAVCFGCLSCFGLNVVANSSEIDMGITHLIGAFICFTSATIYFLIQTKISYHFINHTSVFSIGRWLFIFRCFLCLMMSTFYSLTLWFGNLAIREFTGAKLNYWRPEDGGFEYRLVATFSEWLTAITIMAYIISFSVEFRKIECENITVRIKNS